MRNLWAAHICRIILRKVGLDVAIDSSSNTREHYQIDKTRLFKNEDNVTDCPNFSRKCEKYGQNDRNHLLENKEHMKHEGSKTHKKQWHTPALRKLPIASATGPGNMNQGQGKGKGMSGNTPVS